MVSNIQVKARENPEAWRMQPVDIVRATFVHLAKSALV